MKTTKISVLFVKTYRIKESFLESSYNFLVSDNFIDTMIGFELNPPFCAEALSGGSSSVVYKISDINNKTVVIKFIPDETLFFQEKLGYQIARKVNVNTPNIIGESVLADNINRYLILEYMTLENLYEYRSTKRNAYEQVGRTIKLMHDADFIKYENNFVMNTPIINEFIRNLDINYLSHTGLLTTNELYKILNLVNTYKTPEKRGFVHGDLRDQNIFFDGNNISLFDFRTSYEDPLFDIAIYKYRCLSENMDKQYNEFVLGYQTEIDSFRLDYVLAIICLTKAVKNHKLGKYSKLQWNIDYLKGFVKQYGI